MKKVKFDKPISDDSLVELEICSTSEPDPEQRIWYKPSEVAARRKPGEETAEETVARMQREDSDETPSC